MSEKPENCLICGMKLGDVHTEAKHFTKVSSFPCGYWGRSQKLDGLLALKKSYNPGLSTLGFFGVIGCEADLAKFKAKYVNSFNDPFTKMFARPCPVRPRHGFVESRVISSPAELDKIWAETIAADPEGLVMVVPLVSNAEFNLIWTPSLLTVGAGHDGATGGKNTITFPLSGVSPIQPTTTQMARLNEDEDPYIEIVAVAGGNAVLTQLRAGPKVEGISKDYIPSKLEVSQIISPDGCDLLKWEEKCKNAEPGTVIYHPGGSPTDHYFVHARTFGIPTLTTRCPAVGEVLLPQVGIKKWSASELLRGLVAGDKFNFSHKGDDGEAGYRDAANLMLHALHNSPQLTGTDSFYIGVGVAFMLRLGMIALRGEARHEEGMRGHRPSRASVYKRYRNVNLRKHRASLTRLITLFRFGSFSGGMGGNKWAQCASALLPLFNAVQQISAEPSQQNVNELLRAFNVAINQAHHNGWWMNKFIDNSALDKVQNGALQYSATLGRILTGLEPMKQLSEAVIERSLGKWRKWETLTQKILGIELVELSYQQNKQALRFDIHIKLNRSRKVKKSLNVSVNDLMKKAANGILKDISIDMTDKGMLLNVGNVPIWEEQLYE